MSAAATFPAAMMRCRPSKNPRAGSSGVLRTLARRSAPSPSSRATTSVNVPPISTATLQLMPFLPPSRNADPKPVPDRAPFPSAGRPLQHQVAQRVRPRALARRDEHRGVVLLDHRRAAHLVAGNEVFSRKHRARAKTNPTSQVDGPLAAGRQRPAACRRARPREDRPVRDADAPDPHGYHLDAVLGQARLLSGPTVPVRLPMGAVETLDHGGWGGRAGGAARAP